MALSLNGMAVLGKISANAKLFGDVKADADKQARSMVVKQLKAKADDVDQLRAVKKAIGPAAFEHIVDGLSDNDIKSMLNKADKYNPAMKKARPAARREHFRELAAGKAKPVPAPETPAKRPAKRKPRRTLNLESMKAKPRAKKR
ncbi:hypothetical protein V6C03_10995 [Methyloligella sp. 2.7D]|uniref:hypothetical protein n=1 Tax=unclassified Methyloligella TaxID=2625955 RepID=UPI00157C89AA|nr:hypothetical protein [Methyloligella sp. GL2]QKP77651.1 hypothetical protein HT051_09465 [Methyloligella sp. GL2]